MSALVASIVVPTVANPLLEGALRALAAGGAGVPFEVVLALDGVPGERVRPSLERARVPVRVVGSAENVGFGAVCNRAAAAARGRHLVFLNDDTEVRPGWLEALVATAERTSAGAVGSTVLWPDGRLQEAGSIVWRDGSTWAIGRGEPFDRYDRGDTRPADYASACSLLVRRDLWEAIGGFDPRFRPAYYEDADLCFEIRRRGHAVLHEPRSVLVHHETASSTPEAKIELMLRNRAVFVGKWAAVLAAHEPPPADPRDAVPAALARAEATARALARPPAWKRALGRLRRLARAARSP